MSPEGTSIRENVHFVEQHSAIPQRFTLIVNVWSLPGIDLIAPSRGICQSIACDLPGIRSSRPVEIRIVAIPFASGTESHNRKIPRDDHGNHPLLSRLQRKSNCDCSRELFTAAYPRLIAV